MDMQRKLRSRIEEKMQNRGESVPVTDEETMVEKKKEEIGDDIVEEFGGDIGAEEETLAEFGGEHGEIGEVTIAEEGEVVKLLS
ncbi:hypothetical protein ACTXT7_005291 [Hymenolepis weldensis]